MEIMLSPGQPNLTKAANTCITKYTIIPQSEAVCLVAYFLYLHDCNCRQKMIPIDIGLNLTSINRRSYLYIPQLILDFACYKYFVKKTWSKMKSYKSVIIL